MKQELKHKQENVLFLEDKKREALKTVQMLQREIVELESTNDRIKVDIKNVVANCQGQQNKNQELSDDILNNKNKLSYFCLNI